MDNINNEAELRLQEYQEQMLELINECPSVINHIDWLIVTNGFDPNEINYYFMGIFKRSTLEKLIEQLKKDWDKNLPKHDPRMYVDHYTCDILRYGSDECPVRFSTFLDENKRVWLERETELLLD